MTKIEVVDVRKKPILAIIVLQKIEKEIEVADDLSISTNLKSPKNIHTIITTQVIIQTHQTTVPIQTTAVIHENIEFFQIFNLQCIINVI